MKKLSTALTITLLLGSALNAATLQLNDGSLTPRSAATAWIAEKQSGKTPTTPASKIHESLYKAADDAQKAGNPERVLELWRTQQAFATESGNKPFDSMGTYRIIQSYSIHHALKIAADAAQEAGNPERVLELWRTQQAFATESGEKPFDSMGTYRIIQSYSIHEAFSTTLNKETDNQRIVSLYELWMDFEKIEKISSYSSIKRLESFKAKYDAAKKEVEKVCSLVPTDKRFETGAAPTEELSVKALVGLYGTMMLDTSSFGKFVDSFQCLYKTAALRLHPDKSADDAEKFKTLGAHKAWVESLTLDVFTSSPK